MALVGNPTCDMASPLALAPGRRAVHGRSRVELEALERVYGCRD